MYYSLIEAYERAKFIRLENYYKGKSDIQSREMEGNKPNNKIGSPFAIAAVDTFSGYFMGAPVAYSSENDALMTAIQDIYDYNDEQEVNNTHAIQCAVKGASYELLFTDENSNLRFTQVNRENVIVIYDDKIIPEMKEVIYYRKVEKPDKTYCYSILVYDTENVTEYECTKQGDVENKKEPHFFNQIPWIEYSINPYKMGIFEKAIDDINAYEKSVSDTANDLEYFTDAYFWLPGFGAFDPSNTNDVARLASMKQQRVFLPPDETSAKPEFIIKNINDTATENHKDRLKKDIHKKMSIPDLTDEHFMGNQSGVSMKYKLWGLENICSTAERRFKKAIQKRIELICEWLKLKTSSPYDYREIKMTFSRNLPDDMVEYISMVEKLSGTHSLKTLLEWNPRIDNPQEELDRIAEEKEANAPYVMDLTEPQENQEVEDTQTEDI